MTYSIFLKFSGKDKIAIETFRETYDSLFNKIEAHITLVFPFDVIKNLEGLKKKIVELNKKLGFYFSLNEVLTFENKIGYCKVIKGNSQIVELYNELNGFLGQKVYDNFSPHVTISRNASAYPYFIQLPNNSFFSESIVLEEFDSTNISNIIFESKKCNENDARDASHL